MDEKTLMETLKVVASGLDEVAVHDWPFEEGADRAFYVETEDGKRFSVRVEEFARFQDGSMYF